ncbi:unnamed protein product [Caenorhabditis bovis]|uniref:Uncharacterized protein n=1 Tax=Caenorhabditis bovis TaxID=2654633 RepID=A0A8S1E921_9PELO|nr:unnamed protein product [Caenorhabditis bovis]
MALIIASNQVTKKGYEFYYNHQLLVLTTGSGISKTTNNQGVVMMMDSTHKVHFEKVCGERANLIKSKLVPTCLRAD